MQKLTGLNLLVFGLLMAGSLHAQMVTPPDKDQLLNGDPAGQTMSADSNGFPSPQKILLLKDQLNLTKDQVKKIDEMLKNLPVSATVKGQEIVEAEEELSKIFVTGNVNEKTLRTKLERLGKLRAELRFIHLQAYLKAKQVLSANQWERVKGLLSSEVK
jgi:Spy/CpxP family protein refolding chaperone